MTKIGRTCKLALPQRSLKAVLGLKAAVNTCTLALPQRSLQSVLGIKERSLKSVLGLKEKLLKKAVLGLKAVNTCKLVLPQRSLKSVLGLKAVNTYYTASNFSYICYETTKSFISINSKHCPLTVASQRHGKSERCYDFWKRGEDEDSDFGYLWRCNQDKFFDDQD